jgi:type II secretory pathway component PulM
MITEILLGIVILLLTSISYMLILALRRINDYEQFIIQLDQIVTYCSEQIQRIDDRGTFESDDEVGTFFEQLKQLQSLLTNIFEPNTNEELDATKEN